GLVLLAERVPGGAVRPARRRELVAAVLVAADLDDPAFACFDIGRLRDHLVDIELVVVAGADEASKAALPQLLVGLLHPLLDPAKHQLVEELGGPPVLALELARLVGGRPEWVIAAAPDPRLVFADLVLAAEVVTVL